MNGSTLPTRRHREIKDPYYKHIAALDTAERILREFGLAGAGCHIVNGHVPVRAIEGESPIKGGGRLIIIDGGFCRAYHQRTGIAAIRWSTTRAD